jgi:hypothetical protein
MRPTMEVETDQLLSAYKNGQLVLAPTRKLQPQRQNLFFQGKRPSRLAALTRAMTALLQRGQIVRIITAPPTIERLAADAKVTAGPSRIAALTIDLSC